MEPHRKGWRRSFPASSPLVVLAVAACVGLGGAPARAAECLQAIFFDLGDTLVVPAGGGMFTLRAGAQESVDALQAAGVEIGIITNVPAGWTRDDLEAVLQQPEFLDEFDVLVLSSQTPGPVQKPNPLIYTHAHGLLPAPQPPIAATAFVGETIGEIANSQAAPTSGARAVGMIGIHLSDSAPSPLTDYTLATSHLVGVLDIIDETCTVFESDFEDAGLDEWSSCTGCS